MTEDLIDETLSHYKSCFKAAGLDKGDIDEVIMVGGSTKITKSKPSC